jgi:Flp pilus assembly pilin Flp
VKEEEEEDDDDDDEGHMASSTRQEGIAMRIVELGWFTLARVMNNVHIGAGRLHGRHGGQSTVEYALVGALVVIAAAGALTVLGGELTTVFTNISRTLGTAAGR